MKLQLNPLQCRILHHLATFGVQPANTLTLAMMPATDLPEPIRQAWETEIRLSIDLLVLYGTISTMDTLDDGCLLVASAHVIAWSRAMRASSSATQPHRRGPARIAVATASALLMAACSTVHPERDSAQLIQPYADGSGPPERMEQFFNPSSGQMVYRFCVGSECPEPTPKVPVNRIPRVTEIEIDGRKVPVDQNADVIAGLNNRPQTGKPKGAKKPPSDALAATVAAQLEDQRRDITGQPRPVPLKNRPANAASEVPANAAPPTMPAARKGVHFEPATAVVPVPPKAASAAPAMAAPPSNQSALPTGMPAAAPGPVPTQTTPKPLPAAPQGMVPAAPTNMPTFPTTGTRVPPGPAASAPQDALPPLAYNASTRATGSFAPAVHVGESREQRSMPGAVDTPERLVATWAALWEAKNADAYFALYANDFMPTYGRANSAIRFTELRRDAMARAGLLKVKVELISLDTQDDKATVRFWQTYSSAGFKSRVVKSLDLVRSEGNWKIHRERIIPRDARLV